MCWCRECNLLEGLAPAIRLLSSMCPEEPSVPQLFSWASAVLSMDDAWDNGDWCVVFCCKRCICFVVSCFFVDSEGFLKKISGRWKWFIQHIFPQYFCRRFIPVVETSKSPILPNPEPSLSFIVIPWMVRTRSAGCETSSRSCPKF